MTCPGCARELDMHATAAVDQRPIAVGDATVCAHCGVISRLTDTGLVRMTRAELRALPEPVRASLARDAFVLGVMRVSRARAMRERN